MTTKNNSAIKLLESIRGGPLTFGKMLESIRKSHEITQVALAKKANILGYSQKQFAAKVLEDQARLAGLKVKVILEAA